MSDMVFKPLDAAFITALFICEYCLICFKKHWLGVPHVSGSRYRILRE